MENTELKYITLTTENIDKEHICCAFSDKKCSEGYQLKKEWLKKRVSKRICFQTTRRTGQGFYRIRSGRTCLGSCDGSELSYD